MKTTLLAMTRSSLRSHIVVLIFLCASTIQAAQQITATPGDEKWGDRKRTTSQGQILWYDATGVWFYNGSTTVQLQTTNNVNDPTFTLGSDSTPGHVIAAWRTGSMGTAWVSRDGVPPVAVTYTNPIDAAKVMNLNAVVVDDGHVFMGLDTTDANAHTISLVYNVNPVTGAATLIGGTPVFPANPGRWSQIFTSEGKAVWLDNDGTNPLKLKYYDGRALSSDGDYTTTVDTDATLLQPVISNGKIVYVKNVGGIAQVFLYDTTAVSPSPVQLTNYALTSRNIGTNGGGLLTDGRHVAWSWQTTAGNARYIVMNGQVPMTDATNKLPDGGLPQSGVFFPFHLDRGQMAWLGIGGLHFADSSGISAVPLTPATTVQQPYLADGYVAWLGTATGQTNLDVFRYTASAPGATSPPLALTATAAPGQVTFAWDQILGASSYNVYMAQVSGVTKDNYASLTGGQRFANVASPYAIPGLANGTYYFVVTAVEGGIEGPSSRETSAVVSTAWSRAYETQYYNFFDVKADRANASTLYAASSEGVWKSADGARTWTPLPGPVNGVDTRAVGANGSTVIAVTKDERIFRSTTSGATWSQVASSVSGREVGEQQKSLLNDPLNANTWYAGDLNTTASGVVKSYVVKSVDGGATWTQAGTFSGGSEIRAYGLAADPTTANVVYASGTGAPVAKSTDGASSWNDVSPASGSFYGLAVPTTNTVYTCGADPSTNPVGVYKSTTGGTSWTQMNTGLPTPLPNLTRLFVDPTNASLVFAGGPGGYFFSTNGATSWSAGPGGTYPSSSLQINAMTMTGSRTLVAATSAGIFLLPQAGSPTLAQINPPSGSASGGTVVTLTGTNFVVTSGLRVLLGGSDAVVNLGASTSTSIQATTPAHTAGVVDVVAINPDGQSAVLPAAFTFMPAPTVSAVNPATGNVAGGTPVTITGTNFQSGATATFGGVAATSVAFVNSTTITASTPAHAAGAVDVVVHNPDGQTGTKTSGFTYSTVLTVPANVVATAFSTTQVNITWNAVDGATSYQVYRRSPATGGTFALINSPVTNAYADTGATAGTSYLYRVRAVNATTSSTDSTADLATTILFTDDPIVAGSTVVKAVHLAELRTAVNAVRTLAGAGTFSFVTGAASAGTTITAAQINEVRTALDGGLMPLGLATGGYTDTLTAGVPIKAVHFQEIRNRVK